jgi:predicted RNA binding protein with dsRBD fold (UPF0201 family)
MASVVIELQRDALDRNVSITDLLRKSLVVARKLKINEFEKWVSSELNGYSKTEEIPDYRWATGSVKAWNPYHGWQPVMFPDNEMAAAVSRKPNAQSIAELESLLEKDDGNSTFQMPFPPSVENQLRKAISFDTQITLVIPSTDLVKIVDAVRNIVLNWAMKLEEDGILGEGLSFTSEEKEAATRTEYNITNFYGAIENSQIQQQTKDSIQIIKSVSLDLESISEFINEVRKKINQIGLKGEEEKGLESELISVEAQTKSPKPKNIVIKEGMKSIRTILEGAGGSVAANLLSKLAEIIF